MGTKLPLVILIIHLLIICTFGRGHVNDSNHDEFVRNDYEAILSLFLHIICFIVQSLVITHFYIKMRKPTRTISKSIKFAAVSVIGFTWIAILFDIIIGIIDLFIKMDFDTYCYTIYYMRYIRIILFEVVLSGFWIIRLNHTFKFSALEIKFITFAIIFGAILLFSSGLSIVFIIIFNQLKDENIFYTKLSSINESAEPIIAGNACYIHWTNNVLFLLLASQFLILLENIGFAAVFWLKLKSLHKIVIHSADLSSQSGQRVQRIYQLQQKHTLLATIPILVTIIVYTLFDISNFFSLPVSTLYFLTNIDMIIKGVCMLLFFKFYARRFGQLCCCCIKCIGMTNEELFPYFNSQPEYRKNNPTIWAQVEKLNAKKQRRKERARSIKNGTWNEEVYNFILYCL